MRPKPQPITNSGRYAIERECKRLDNAGGLDRCGFVCPCITFFEVDDWRMICPNIAARLNRESAK